MAEDLEDQLTRAAIEYHRYPTPGKISITPTKSMTNHRPSGASTWKTSRRRNASRSRQSSASE